MKTSYKISGMTCSGCARAVSNALSNVNGVVQVIIDLDKGQAEVESENKVSTEALEAALADTAYRISGLKSESLSEQLPAEDELSEKNKKLVSAYIEAVGRLDHEELSKYLHPEFKFSGAAVYRSAGDYIEMIKEHAGLPVAGVLLGYDIKAVFADEEDCCIIYDSVSRFPGKKVSFVEWVKVKGGKITSTEVKFNRHQMKRLMMAMNNK